MADMTFEEILEAVQKLPPEQKLLLKHTLDLPSSEPEPTRASLIKKLEVLRASHPTQQPSLRNAYANPDLNDLSNEQLSAAIHDAAIEWEQEIDEFFGDKT